MDMLQFTFNGKVTCPITAVSGLRYVFLTIGHLTTEVEDGSWQRCSAVE
jgi:hypothetical protein